MMHATPLRRAAPLAAAFIIIGAARIAQAQNFSTAIVGCDEIGCGEDEIGGDDTTTTECKLIDETFNEIGLARIPLDDDVEELPAGISWVQGNSVTDAGGSDERYPTERVLRRNWYFGTPAGFDLRSTTHACAAFFHKSTAEFPGGNTETAAGTCEQAMGGGDCVDALMRRARSLRYEADEEEDICETLEKNLRDNFDQECREVAGSPYWRNVTVRREFIFAPFFPQVV